MITELIAKAIVIVDDGQALLLKRSDTDAKRPGGFDLPGGGVEEGESMKEGVIREILEETGLSIMPTDVHLVWANAVIDHDRNLIRLLYVAKAPSTDVRLSFEHSVARWLPIDNLPEELNHPQWSVGIRYTLKHDLVS